jgi:hypothetical protein
LHFAVAIASTSPAPLFVLRRHPERSEGSLYWFLLLLLFLPLLLLSIGRLSSLRKVVSDERLAGMRTPRWLEFFKTAGLLGGSSAIFAVVLFAIAVWEHYKDKNVPASWLVGSGVFFFAFGLYKAWSKERDDKEAALARIERPNFEFLIGPVIWVYSEVEDKTLFFPLCTILNRGHRSITRNWSATYRIGAASETMTSFYIRTPFTLPVGDEELIVANADLLNVKTLEAAVERGNVANGRMLWTVPGNRSKQIESCQYSMEIICEDYESNSYSAIYTPDPKPASRLITHANETARKAIKLPE